jgi:hypothetical protein
MGRKDALASLVGGGEGSRDAASEAARDIDWVKVRRVQHGLSRPSATRDGTACCEEVAAETRSRRAIRLAYALGFIAGILLGLMFLKGLGEDPYLLAASCFAACAGSLAANRAVN